MSLPAPPCWVPGRLGLNVCNLADGNVNWMSFSSSVSVFQGGRGAAKREISVGFSVGSNPKFVSIPCNSGITVCSAVKEYPVEVRFTVVAAAVFALDRRIESLTIGSEVISSGVFVE